MTRTVTLPRISGTGTAPAFSHLNLGLWNLFFIGEALLVSLEYLSFDVVYNAALLALVLLPLKNAGLRRVRTLMALPPALALLYHESFLPPLSALSANAASLSDFSLTFILDFLQGAVNPLLVAGTVLLVVLYYILRDYLRFTPLTLGLIAGMTLPPLTQTLLPALQAAPALSESALSVTRGDPLAQSAPPTPENLERWYHTFTESEALRSTVFPETVKSPFDIILLNICSLSTDDLRVSALDSHPVLTRFDVNFKAFNSATSYSTPATLRLLKSVCGQSTHSALYDPPRASCELFTRLQELGFSGLTFFDHPGTFGKYLASLNSLAGLTSPLESQSAYRPLYRSFDDEPIYDSQDVFKAYLDKRAAKDAPAATLTLMNLIALHDGNRSLNGRALDFRPRAEKLLDDIGAFMDALERTGRPTVLILVPEHGAALRGDRIQLSRLRDIPSPALTHVPARVRLINAGRTFKPLNVEENVSYFALSALLSRIMEHDFLSPGATLSLEELVSGLPLTEAVSENEGAIVLNYQGEPYLKLEGREWIRYPR